MYIDNKNYEDYESIKQKISELKNNYSDIKNTCGLLFYGNDGIGKTTLIKSILTELNYEILEYDHTISGTKNIENLFYKLSKNESIINIFNKTPKRIVILIDNLHFINKNEKGTLNDLIKLLRPKKTKSQKIEKRSNNLVIAISNINNEKKIVEFKSKVLSMKINDLSNRVFENILQKNNIFYDNNTIKYISGNIYKLKHVIYFKHSFETIFPIINIVDNINDTKLITKDLINNNYTFQHYKNINETDRTSISLLYHENIIDILNYSHIHLYIKCLNNFCFADYLDRITFQKQLWCLNERSSIIKISYNNYLLKNIKKSLNDIRFTKILTKYSTEYNNKMFLIKLSQKLNFDIDELYEYYFLNPLINNENITQLENNRILKFLDLQK